MVSRSRIPPPSCNGDLLADNAHDLADRHLFLGLPANAPLRSTRLQPFGARSSQWRAIAAGSSENTVADWHLTLLQADAVTILDIDCGKICMSAACATASDATVGNARIESDAAVPVTKMASTGDRRCGSSRDGTARQRYLRLQSRK